MSALILSLFLFHYCIPHFQDTNTKAVYFEPIIRDTVELRFFAETFYAYPPGEGHNEIHSIDIDSVWFLSMGNKGMYSPGNITDPIHNYLWLKYKGIITSTLNEYAQGYPYKDQRKKWVGIIKLVPHAIPDDLCKNMKRVSNLLTRKKWQKKWDLSFLSSKELNNARKWVLSHLDPEYFLADSLYIIESFRTDSPKESVYLYSPRNNLAEGWLFSCEKKAVIPEPLLSIDSEMLSVIHNLIHLVTAPGLKDSTRLTPVIKVEEDSISANHYCTVLLLVSNGKGYNPVLYEVLKDSPSNELDLWLL